MNTKFSILIGLTLFAFTSFSCASMKKKGLSKDEPKAAYHITEKDNEKRISLKVNDAFDATFKECIGCRDVWTAKGFDEAQIELVNSTYDHKSCENCTGGNQDHTFHFLAKKAGKSNLTFTYFDKKILVRIVVE